MRKAVGKWLKKLREDAEEDNIKQQQRQEPPVSPLPSPAQPGRLISDQAITYGGMMPPGSSPPLRQLSAFSKLDIIASRVVRRFRYKQAYPRVPPPPVKTTTTTITTRVIRQPPTPAEKKRRLIRFAVIMLSIMRFVPFLRYAIRLPSAQRLLRREEAAKAEDFVGPSKGKKRRRRGRAGDEGASASSAWRDREQEEDQQPVVLSQYRMVKEPDLGFLPLVPPPPPSWLMNVWSQARGAVMSVFKRGGEGVVFPKLPPGPTPSVEENEKKGKNPVGQEGPKFEVSLSFYWPFITITRGGDGSSEEGKTKEQPTSSGTNGKVSCT